MDYFENTLKKQEIPIIEFLKKHAEKVDNRNNWLIREYHEKLEISKIN